MRATARPPRQVRWTGLAAAFVVGLARAASGLGSVSAGVVAPLEVETPAINQLFDRFAPPLVLPGDPTIITPRILPVAAGLPPPGGAPAAPLVETVRSADGSVSLNITGGGALAHVVTRSPDGQLRVDFN